MLNVKAALYTQTAAYLFTAGAGFITQSMIKGSYYFEQCESRAGLPDFSWHNIPKRGKYTK
jgi:hypothetical protein